MRLGLGLPLQQTRITSTPAPSGIEARGIEAPIASSGSGSGSGDGIGGGGV